MAKFEYVYDLLGIQPGDIVYDVGCGYGDWILFLREQDVQAIGINITDAQVKICRGRGLSVFHADWREAYKGENPLIQKHLYGTAQHVTFFDTVLEFRTPPQLKNYIHISQRLFRFFLEKWLTHD